MMKKIDISRIPTTELIERFGLMRCTQQNAWLSERACRRQAEKSSLVEAVYKHPGACTRCEKALVLAGGEYIQQMWDGRLYWKKKEARSVMVDYRKLRNIRGLAVMDLEILTRLVYDDRGEVEVSVLQAQLCEVGRDVPKFRMAVERLIDSGICRRSGTGQTLLFNQDQSAWRIDLNYQNHVSAGWFMDTGLPCERRKNIKQKQGVTQNEK